MKTTEEKIKELKDEIGNELEWLRSRLGGHSLVQYPIKGRLPARHEHFVTLDYVDARIDDLISVLGLTTTKEKDSDFKYGVFNHVIEEIKSFISTSIQEAITEERERVVGYIEKLKIPKEFESEGLHYAGNGYEFAIGTNQALDDLLSSLDKALPTNPKGE